MIGTIASGYMDMIDGGCLDLTFICDNVEGISCLPLQNIAQFLGYVSWDHKYRIPCLWGALMLCIVNISTRNYKLS